jgi:ActR/RegA family two-component response regulator
MSTQPRSDLKSTAPSRVSRTASARQPLLAGAHRDLREPLTAMLRLNNDWDVRSTDMVAVRMIEQQRQALEVMADLIDSFLTIAEPRAEEWSAEWCKISTLERPELPVAVGPASRVRCVLLVNEDRGVLGALRIYLLCAGYRVFPAANADEALDRAWMARMATSLIDIIIVNSDLTGEDDGLAVIDKTRLLLGYNVPAVLLTTQTSIEIGKAALVTDVSLLRNPVNLDELNALVDEILKRPRRFRLARLRTTGVKQVQDELNPEARLLTGSQSHSGGHTPKWSE